MPNWKKLIVSGSDASLNSLVVATNVNAQSFTGSLFGTASNAVSSSYAFSASYAVSASHAPSSTTASFAQQALSASFALTASIARNLVIRARNGNNASLPAGTVVHITGAVGDNPIFNTASFDTELLSANTLGILSSTAASGQDVDVVVNGFVLGVNTDPADGYVAGDIIYLSSSGQFTRVQPQAPQQIVTLGQVLRAQQNNGSLYVAISNGWELDELHNVRITSVAYGDLLVNSGSLWVNSKQLSGSYSLTGSFTTINGGFTGSLSGTASYALTASGVQGGTTKYIPIWNSGTELSSSVAYQTGSIIIVPGKLGVGTATTGSFMTETPNVTYYPTIQARTTVDSTNAGIRNPGLGSYTLITGAPSVTQYGGLAYVETSQSNANSFSGAQIGFDTKATHWGSGNIAQLTGIQAQSLLYSGSSSSMRAGLALAGVYGSGTQVQTIGLSAQSNNYETATITRAYGLDAYIGNRSGGTMTNAIAIGAQIQNTSTGTITNAYGVSIGGVNDLWSNPGGGTVTNSYGLFISSSIDIGTTRYAIYSDSTSNTYIKGNVGINKTTPVYNLDVSGSGNFSSGLTVTGSAIITQDVTASNALISGTITAQTLVVQTVTSSIVYSSGSNIFGNQLTDVQQFTGSLRATGSSDNWVVGGNFGFGTTAPAGRIHAIGDVISQTSLNIAGQFWFNSRKSRGTVASPTTVLVGDDAGGILFTGYDGSSWRSGAGIGAQIQSVSAGSLSSNLIFYAGNGSVSSATRVMVMRGDTQNVLVGTTTDPGYKVNVNGSGNFSSNLTATGSIKFPSLTNVNQVNVVGYDTTTGQLYYQTTSSLSVASASYALTSSYSDAFSIGSSLMKYGAVASSIAGANNVFTQNTSSYSGAKYLYTVKNGSNARTGEVMAVWTGGSVQFTDTSTLDIGSTTAVTASVSIVGADAQLNFQTNTSGWKITSQVTYL